MSQYSYLVVNSELVDLTYRTDPPEEFIHPRVRALEGATSCIAIESEFHSQSSCLAWQVARKVSGLLGIGNKLVKRCSPPFPSPKGIEFT